MREINLQMVMAMIKAGMTNKSLAAASGISEVSISLIKGNRRKPKPETAQAIAAALNTSPAALGWGVPS